MRTLTRGRCAKGMQGAIQQRLPRGMGSNRGTYRLGPRIGYGLLFGSNGMGIRRLEALCRQSQGSYRHRADYAGHGQGVEGEPLGAHSSTTRRRAEYGGLYPHVQKAGQAVQDRPRIRLVRLQLRPSQGEAVRRVSAVYRDAGLLQRYFGQRQGAEGKTQTISGQRQIGVTMTHAETSQAVITTLSVMPVITLVAFVFFDLGFKSGYKAKEKEGK